MPFAANLLHHPRRLFLRRALFQVHLWLGIFLSLYVALIGLSGSILVFQDELRAHGTRDLHADLAHLSSPEPILTAARLAYPRETLTYLAWPSQDLPAWTLYLRTAAGSNHAVLAAAADGHLLTARPHLFIDTVHDFHVYLLLGQTGFMLNCAAGIGLLILALTGAVLWWPGIRLWLRGLRINLRASWKRINYDTHNLVGILTLAIVSFWGFTAIAFLWPAQTAAAIKFVSPLRGMAEPRLPPPSTDRVPHVSLLRRGLNQHEADPQAVLSSVLAQIHTLSPHGSLSGIALPAESTGNLVAYVDTRAPGDFSHRDIHTFSGSTGQLLTTWHYGEKHTLGDWLLWLVYPLHFGTLWGLPVKILWSLLGLSLPVLSLTGLVMYWNRYLSKRRSALKLGRDR